MAAEPAPQGESCEVCQGTGTVECWNPGGPCPVPNAPGCHICGRCNQCGTAAGDPRRLASAALAAVASVQPAPWFAEQSGDFGHKTWHVDSPIRWRGYANVLNCDGDEALARFIADTPARTTDLANALTAALDRAEAVEHVLNSISELLANDDLESDPNDVYAQVNELREMAYVLVEAAKRRLPACPEQDADPAACVADIESVAVESPAEEEP